MQIFNNNLAKITLALTAWNMLAVCDLPNLGEWWNVQITGISRKKGYKNMQIE